MYIVWDCIIQIVYLFFHSLVLILHIPAYLEIKVDQFFSDKNFFDGHFTYKLVYYNLYNVSNFSQN